MIIVYGNEKCYPFYLIEFDYNKNNNLFDPGYMRPIPNKPIVKNPGYVHINKLPVNNPNYGIKKPRKKKDK